MNKWLPQKWMQSVSGASWVIAVYYPLKANKEDV